MCGSCSDFRRRGRGQKGYVLILGVLMLFFILVPAAGLAIDVGMMYLVKSVLGAASDGAALAGARALNRGSDDAAQRANAEATANTYLHANFPTGYMWSTNLQVSSAAAIDSQYIRSITTTASVQMPLIFMRFFRTEHATVSTSSKATRRDANVMFVMDRSGSLGSGAGSACEMLKAAAKLFVDRFSEGRDNVGLITFATNSRVDSPLSTTFKTAIDNTLTPINCNGFTNMSQGLWEAYDALATLGQTGALNAILLFTDGLPTAITQDFPVRPSPDTCTPKPTITGVITYSSPYGVSNMDYPPDQQALTTAHNCGFLTSNLSTHLQYAPLTDHWQNPLDTGGGYTRYKGVTHSGAGLSFSSTNIQNFSTNAADSAGWRIRNGVLSATSGRSLAGVVIFTIGYGASSDPTLLKRIANDVMLSPNPVAAGAQGKYRYAGDLTQLNDAFMAIASEVLRLAQ
jgi:Mg-chelatase subunit ChlD